MEKSSIDIEKRGREKQENCIHYYSSEIFISDSHINVERGGLLYKYFYQQIFKGRQGTHNNIE